MYSINLVSSNFVRSRDLLQQVSPGPENTWVEASTILFSVCMIVSPVRISVWVFMSIKVESVCVSLLAAFSTNIKSWTGLCLATHDGAKTKMFRERRIFMSWNGDTLK